jgi:hypothetical protein
MNVVARAHLFAARLALVRRVHANLSGAATAAVRLHLRL